MRNFLNFVYNINFEFNIDSSNVLTVYFTLRDSAWNIQSGSFGASYIFVDYVFPRQSISRKIRAGLSVSLSFGKRKKNKKRGAPSETLPSLVREKQSATSSCVSSSLTLSLSRSRSRVRRVRGPTRAPGPTAKDEGPLLARLRFFAIAVVITTDRPTSRPIDRCETCGMKNRERERERGRRKERLHPRRKRRTEERHTGGSAAVETHPAI